MKQGVVIALVAAVGLSSVLALVLGLVLGLRKDDTTTTTGPTSAEPQTESQAAEKPQAETQTEPQAETKAEPQAETQTEPKGVHETLADTRQQAQTQATAGGKSNCRMDVRDAIRNMARSMEVKNKATEWGLKRRLKQDPGDPVTLGLKVDLTALKNCSGCFGKGPAYIDYSNEDMSKVYWRTTDGGALESKLHLLAANEDEITKVEDWFAEVMTCPDVVDAQARRVTRRKRRKRAPARAVKGRRRRAAGAARPRRRKKMQR